MDHLPLPSGVSTSAFKVPFLARPEHTYIVEGSKGVQSLQLFPSSKGFNFGREDISHTVTEISSFIQSWLYFGLLAEFLQKPIDRRSFMRREASKDGGNEEELFSSLALKDLKLPLLRTFDLGAELGDLDTMDANGLPTNSYKLESPERQRVLELLTYAEGRCIFLDKKFKAAPSPGPEILLSIRVLIDTLKSVVIGETPTSPLGKGLPGNAATLTMVRRVMVGNGWCISQIEEVFKTLHSPLVCYVAQIRRQGRPGITHANCSPEACIAFNIDLRIYQPRHVTEICGCSFVSAPTYDIQKILKDGGIPLISVKRDKTGQLSLKVKARSPSMPYIAFSHIWRDGLGHGSENAILTCQLERLDGYVRNRTRISQPVTGGRHGRSSDLAMSFSNSKQIKYFWLDTLCMPSPPKGPSGDSTAEVWQMAANNTAAIFSSASRVVILDRELTDHVALKGLNYTEITSRILFSSWASRCWALVEGAMSNAPYVQCADGNFDIHNSTAEHPTVYLTVPENKHGPRIYEMAKHSGRIFNKNRSRSASSRRTDPKDGSESLVCERRYNQRIGEMLNKPLEQLLSDVFLRRWQKPTAVQAQAHEDKSVDDPMEIVKHFAACWNALGKRQTSRSQDRVVILSLLLRMNISDILTSRWPMLSILKKLPGLPLPMLYDPRSPGKQGVLPDEQRSEEDESFYEHHRWLPLQPSNFHLQLDEEANGLIRFMEWDNEFLFLDAKPKFTEMFLMTEGPSLQDAEDFNFVIKGGSTMKVKMNFHYNVHFIRDFVRPGNVPLPEVENPTTCFIMDREDWRQGADRSRVNVVVRGACMHVQELAVRVEAPRGKAIRTVTRVTAVYDCPIRVHITSVIAQKDKADVGSVVTTKPVPSWSLRMRHGRSPDPPAPEQANSA